ncbi:hypothetical protein HYU23_03030 [Candidatus Woesearchaeota archaeon]|nr:hypothetical protein [Candidatus Woesearchaeota archaeon]
MNKKGEGEQFNWIFVIIAGGIILGFFIMFTFKYIELQEKRQDVDTVRFFGGKVISASSKLQVGSGGAAVDSNEQEGLRFGYFVDLGYKCAGNESTLLINKGRTAWYKLDDEVVFMDDEIRVNALDLWILPWNFPFYVTNFIYLSDPRTNFYFVKDQSTKEFVDNLDISSAFKVEKVDQNILSIKQNSKVVYFLNKVPLRETIIKLKGNLTSANFVYINMQKKEAQFFEDGKWSEAVKFYISDDNNGHLLGAIFSNNADNFNCNVNRALDRTKTIANIYSRRADLLGQLDRRSECHYNEISRSLSKYASGELLLVDVIKNQNLAGAGCIWVF